MLAAMIPAFGMIASAEDSVYTVTDATSITALIADTEANVAGNTMKLTQDITYEASTTSLWNGLLMNVDGNGHTITLKNGTYHYAVLFGLENGTSATELRNYTIKNLAVVMENDNAVVTSNETQYLALFGNQPNNIHLNVENCYFDLNFKLTGTASNNGTAVLISRYTSSTGRLEITAKNSYFKMDTFSGVTDLNSTAYGQHGALLGRRWSDTNSLAVFNVENCGFDVNYGTNISKGGAVVGDQRGTTKTTITATGTNLIYNGIGVTNSTATSYDTNFQKNVTNVGIDTELTLATGWTYTTTGSPVPATLVKTFPSLFRNSVADAITNFEGYQTSVKYTNATTSKDVFDIRLVATITADDATLATYKNVGFKVVANYGDTNVSKAQNAPLTTLYTSVLARDGIVEDKTYTVADFLGENVDGYIFALPIKNIDAAAGIITFEVTTYYTNANDEVINGSTYTFTVDTSNIPSGSI